MLFQLDGIWFAAGVTVGLLMSSVVMPGCKNSPTARSVSAAFAHARRMLSISFGELMEERVT